MSDQVNGKRELAMLAGSVLVAGIAGSLLLGRRQRELFAGSRVLITGGSRGLGLALAEEFRRQGAHVALCARDERELDRARHLLHERVPSHREILPIVADVTDAKSVGAMLREFERYFGAVDVLVNNAGIIQVGPLSAQRREDFQAAMNANFWGTVNTTLAVLPEMRRRRAGRIVNITSIGAKVAVPHLLPYSASKFAVLGFSLGLRNELQEAGISVTTVVPGLMRTGSHLNAEFKGDARAEYSWFSLGASLPGISISAQKAARRIVAAAADGSAEIVLGMPAKLLSAFHSLFPGLGADLLGAVNRALPHSDDPAQHTGHESRSAVSESFATELGRTAADRYNETPEAA